MAGSKNRLDPHITSSFTGGLTTGHLSADDRAWFASRGPGDAVKDIRIPTFLVEGTADTLFTLHEAIENYAILRANHVPDEDAVVLRRPRRLPDRLGAGRATWRRP